MVISSGKAVKETTVPDVVGMSEDKAQQTLEDESLVVDYKSEYSDTVEEGKVISTNPGAGASVKEGSKVTMVVSQGAEKVSVPTTSSSIIPSLTYMHLKMRSRFCIQSP